MHRAAFRFAQFPLTLLLIACAEPASVAPGPTEEAQTSATSTEATEASTEATPAPSGGAAEVPEGERRFGGEFQADVQRVTLAQLGASAADYDGQRVHTDGTISAVCQRMGCWMELREGEMTVRVPMAGHSFFLPRDVADRPAEVQGIVQVRELSEAEREHLASEGAEATQVALQINADAVVVR